MNVAQEMLLNRQENIYKIALYYLPDQSIITKVQWSNESDFNRAPDYCPDHQGRQDVAVWQDLLGGWHDGPLHRLLCHLRDRDPLLALVQG